MDLSEPDWGEKDCESFLTDPEELWDRLPQPYRMIDKVLDRLLCTVWESVLTREAARSACQDKSPHLILTADEQLPESTNCLVCSGDGRFLAVGHAQGLSVSYSSSLACISSWVEDGLDITAVQMTAIGQEAYLISTVDDMGIARILALNSGRIHLLKIVNKTEDINQRNVCVNFELSEGGYFGAAQMCCNGDFWLDIFNFPLEPWLEELKQAASQSQMSTGGDVRWTPCSVLMKIAPPTIPTGTMLLSPTELLHKAEFGSGMGTGHNHMITANQWKEHDAAFRSKYGSSSDHMRTKPCLGGMHFLLPGGLSAESGGDVTSRTGEVPEAVCLWWTGSNTLLQYSLCKAKNKQDGVSRPTRLWHNAQEIVCSAVSQSGRYIALGLGQSLVSVWDQQTGSPLSVVAVTSADSVLNRVMFVEGGPAPFTQNAPIRQVNLVVSCRSGTILALTAGSLGALTCEETLRPRPRDAGHLPEAIKSLAFLQGLALVLQRNGEMLIVDAINNTTVCRLIAPTTHLPACPLAPVYALDTVRQTLFLRGDRLTGKSAALTERVQSHLLLFQFGVHPLFKPHMVGPGASQQPGMLITSGALEQECDRYLQHRSPLRGNNSPNAVSNMWTELLADLRTGWSPAPLSEARRLIEKLLEPAEKAFGQQTHSSCLSSFRSDMT